MLKGFFYRRTPENDPFQTGIHIRFEINSKESILAKVSNLSPEGIQFLLPRGKVILVPDERILLVLNSPEHGEFKIQSDVYYFSNIIDRDESQLVCYGVKFGELSSSTWELIREFCGSHLPEVTFLSYPSVNQATKKPATPPEIAPQTLAAPEPNEVPLAEILATSFIPFTPIIPIDTPAVIPALTPAPKAAQKSDHNIKAIIDDFLETSASLPEISVMPKAPSIGVPIPAAPIAASKEAGPAAPFLSPVAPSATSPATAPTTKEGPAVKPDLNSFPTAPTFPTAAPITKEGPPVKPDLNSFQPAATFPHTAPVTKEEPPAKSNPSPIQVLAASLAAPTIPHTQPKAQSLSQEMIDRLIEKLQTENNETPSDHTQSTLADSTPDQNPIPDYPRITSDLNTAYQGARDSGQSGELSPKQTGDAKQPAAPTNDPERLEASDAAIIPPFNPFVPFNFKPDNTKQPKPPTDNPGLAEQNTTTPTVPFEPFAPFNFPSGQVKQSDPSTGEPIQSKTDFDVPTAPFGPLDPLNIQSGHVSPPGINSSKAVRSEVKSAMQANSNKNTPNLGDLMINLDSTITKNSSSVPEKPISAPKAAVNKTILSASIPEGATANLSLEELQKMELPYSGKEPSRPTLTSSKKSVVPIMADIPITTMAKPSGIPSNSGLPQEKPVTPGTKTPSLGSAIIPNTSGVSLDQKAIDKLVVSLLQDMPNDEPVDPPTQTKPTLPPNSGIVKNGTDAKVNPNAPTESGLSHNTVKGLNIFSTDPLNNRVMDQKSIDVIVKNLTESEPNPVMVELGQPASANATPPKSFPPSEPKRTLDQKAIDQVVQALTQNLPTKNNTNVSSGQTVTPLSNNRPNSILNKPVDFAKQERNMAFSLASLRANLQLENGGMLQATVEQLYLGGLMVAIEQELPLNSSLKLNLFGDNIRITEVAGTCTNCEVNPAGKTGFLAEIFFKNMTNAHMEQFRTLIAKLDMRY